MTRPRSNFEVVATYTYLYEADLAKSLLESDGVSAWLLDEHQIRMRWHLADAFGGVRLAVAPDDADRARALLAAAPLSTLGDIPEERQEAHPDETCPECGGVGAVADRRLRAPASIQWVTTLFFLLMGLLVPRRRIATRRECHSCGHRWSVTERA